MMLKRFLVGSLAGVALAPPAAWSQVQPPPPTAARTPEQCAAERHNNRILGTVIGGVAGAFLGDAVAQHGGKPGGAVIGGVAGAAAGNAIGGAADNCGANRYGHYDAHGRWVPRTFTDYGYYGPDGRWVESIARAQAPMAPAAVLAAAERRTVADPGPAADTRDREAWLQDRIQRAMDRGAMPKWRGRQAIRDLDDIRRIDGIYRSADGSVTAEQARDIHVRIDALRAELFADPTPSSYARVN